jgi:ankyrin repeat protein
LLKNGANINALGKFGSTPSQIAMQYKNKEIAECLRNSGIYKTVRGCWLCEPGRIYQWGAHPLPPASVQHPLENFGIPYLSCEYYLLY